jgi:hypothetical protein
MQLGVEPGPHKPPSIGTAAAEKPAAMQPFREPHRLRHFL